MQGRREKGKGKGLELKKGWRNVGHQYLLLDHEFLPFRTMTHIDKWLLLNVLFVFKTVARKGVELFGEEKRFENMEK